ncbi:integrase catalytic domain-containing protein [Trichonephila clavipes]|nr:integrase catalytic domain-containing protein [Trichonephila clavipes]
MYKDTKNFVRSCTVCLSRKNAFKISPAPHQLVEQSQEPGETCHVDIFGPLKTTPKGNIYSYVLSMIDAFTQNTFISCHFLILSRSSKEVHSSIKQTIRFILTLGARYNTGLRTSPTGDELCFYTLRNIREIPSMHSKE